MENKSSKHLTECKKCDRLVIYDNNDSWWNENGCGYSTKLVKCPDCGSIIIVKYVEDEALNINYDERYYF